MSRQSLVKRLSVGRRALASEGRMRAVTSSKQEKRLVEIWRNKNKDGIGFKAEHDSCRVGALRLKRRDPGEALNLGQSVCHYVTVATNRTNKTSWPCICT